MQSPTQKAGQAAEAAALEYLRESGLTWLAQNFSTRFGELDLIMRAEAPTELVFVEVRMRSNEHFGTGAATVTPAKQQRLIRAASIYLARHPTDWPCRFDVVSVSKRNYAWTFDWVRDAFALD